MMQKSSIINYLGLIMGKKLMFPGRDNGSDKEVNWLQVFQVIGIILAILFVGYELMKNNLQNKENHQFILAANAQNIQTQSASFTIALMKSSENMKIWSRGAKGYPDLSQDEKDIYHELLHWWLMFYQNLIQQKNYVSPEIYQAWYIKMSVFQQEKIPESFWRDYKNIYLEIDRDF